MVGENTNNAIVILNEANAECPEEVSWAKNPLKWHPGVATF